MKAALAAAAIILGLLLGLLVAAQPPRRTPEMDAACFEMDAAIVKLEMSARDLELTGQPEAAIAVMHLIAEAQAKQQKDGCHE